MDLYTAISTRRDVESFAQECPPREAVERIIEAAVWAPNHRLTEPWRFHVVAGGARSLMADAVTSWLDATGASEGLQRAARSKLMRAPASVILSQAGGAGDAQRELEDYAACACALQNMLLAAHAEGLAVHVSTDRMIRYEGFTQYLGLQPGDRVVAIINIGYPQAGAAAKRGTRNPPIVRWDWS